MKIAYCLDNIYDHGGIVQITLTKANALAKLYGYEVYLIVKDNQNAPLIPLVDSVRVFDLALNKGKNYLKHWKKLSWTLNTIRPEVAISVGLGERRVLQFIHIDGNPIKIREFHFVRNYMELQAKTTLAKLHVWASKLFDDITNFIGYDRIVVLTEEDRQLHWKGNNKVVVIPNPMTSTPARYSSGLYKVVIAAGRLTEQKNFASLLNIWKNIETKYPDWQLQIWGDGWQQDMLQQKITSLNLQSAYLMGHTSSLLEKMADASIYTMTSVFEGLPLVLIEAMSVGLPVVSYSCPCGPKDIVSDGSDGYLVEINDEITFADKLGSLIENDATRIEMGRKAREKSRRYDLYQIMNQWIELFNSKKR